MEEIAAIPEEKLKYVDETGLDEYLNREYGRAPRGEKVVEKQSGKKFKRTNILAAKCGDEIIEPLQYDGRTDHRLFETWFETRLCRALKKEDVVVMDNATFHRKKTLRKIAERFGVRVIFLPPYSPDLNPIEKFWSWLKSKLRSILRLFPSLDNAISACF
jgi:Transposase and inactivated derivatives